MFHLTLRLEPGDWRAPVHKRLAVALKALLRGYGLRCVELRETPTKHEATKVHPKSDGPDERLAQGSE